MSICSSLLCYGSISPSSSPSPPIFDDIQKKFAAPLSHFRQYSKSLFIKFNSYSYQFKLDMTNHKYDVKNLDTGYHRILKCENSNDIFIDLLMWIRTGERGSLSPTPHPPPHRLS